MERVSRIYIRIHYLSELSRANVRDRLSMIRSMNRAQMECLKIIASQIVGGRMLLMERDYSYFRRFWNLLRSLKHTRLSLRRKKELLLTYHRIIPRLLRREYLHRAITNEIRAVEE